MTCTACGTRIGKNGRRCPNCGRNNQSTSRAGNAPEASTAVLEPSPAQIPGKRHGLRNPKKSAKAENRQEEPAKAPKPAAASDSSATKIPVEEIPLSEESASTPGQGEIRAWIHDQPDRLEDGLSIFTDENAEPVGIDYSTDIGEIDLLARDDAGGLVMILVPDPSADGGPLQGKDLVSDALERVGWVRKHVAEPTQDVRAIVIVDQIPEDFSYAAAAVASTLAFKTYRLEVSFADVVV
jgi:hypothetical protein